MKTMKKCIKTTEVLVEHPKDKMRIPMPNLSFLSIKGLFTLMLMLVFVLLVACSIAAADSAAQCEVNVKIPEGIVVDQNVEFEYSWKINGESCPGSRSVGNIYYVIDDVPVYYSSLKNSLLFDYPGTYYVLMSIKKYDKKYSSEILFSKKFYFTVADNGAHTRPVITVDKPVASDYEEVTINVNAPGSSNISIAYQWASSDVTGDQWWQSAPGYNHSDGNGHAVDTFSESFRGAGGVAVYSSAYYNGTWVSAVPVIIKHNPEGNTQPKITLEKKSYLMGEDIVGYTVSNESLSAELYIVSPEDDYSCLYVSSLEIKNGKLIIPFSTYETSGHFFIEVVSYNSNQRILSYTDFYVQSKEITALVLPSGIVSIGSEAFAGVKNVNIYIPETVEEIAEDAFDPSVSIYSPQDSQAWQSLEQSGYGNKMKPWTEVHTTAVVLDAPGILNYSNMGRVGYSTIQQDGLTIKWGSVANATSFAYAVKRLEGEPAQNGSDNETGEMLKTGEIQILDESDEYHVDIPADSLIPGKFVKIFVQSRAIDYINNATTIYLYIFDDNQPQITGGFDKEQVYQMNLGDDPLQLKGTLQANNTVITDVKMTVHWHAETEDDQFMHLKDHNASSVDIGSMDCFKIDTSMEPFNVAGSYQVKMFVNGSFLDSVNVTIIDPYSRVTGEFTDKSSYSCITGFSIKVNVIAESPNFNITQFRIKSDGALIGSSKVFEGDQLKKSKTAQIQIGPFNESGSKYIDLYVCTADGQETLVTSSYVYVYELEDENYAYQIPYLGTKIYFRPGDYFNGYRESDSATELWTKDGTYQCWGFATYVMYQRNRSTYNKMHFNLRKNSPGLSETDYQKKVKSWVITAGAGAHIRFYNASGTDSSSGYGHSVIVTYVDNKKLCIIQANSIVNDQNVSGRNVISTAEWTWDYFFNNVKYGKNGIRFIEKQGQWPDDLFTAPNGSKASAFLKEAYYHKEQYLRDEGVFNDAWCGYYVNYVAKRSGLSNIFPSNTNCMNGQVLLQNIRKAGGEAYYFWDDLDSDLSNVATKTTFDSFTPQPGDIVVFRTAKYKYAHVGIVDKYDKTTNTITVIHGNWSKKVSETTFSSNGWKTFSTASYAVTGYARPAY